jgi:hypothetical protein
MNGFVAIIIGLVLGAVGATLHLYIVRRRAEMATSGEERLALTTYPLGLLPLAFCVILAAFIHPWAAWATLFGVVVGRIVGIRRLREQ